MNSEDGAWVHERFDLDAAVLKDLLVSSSSDRVNCRNGTGLDLNSESGGCLFQDEKPRDEAVVTCEVILEINGGVSKKEQD